MNAGTENERGHETDSCRDGLWARVRDWFATWTAVFQPHEILRDGLTRRLALRCCNWLWPLEATVRRLIVAAALAFDPARLAPARPGSQPRGPAHPRCAPHRPASFRIVSIRGSGSPKDAASAATAAPLAARHLPFPADDLLRLGAARQRRGQKLALHGLNPLHRRGRIQPTDPDYTAQEADYANSSELLFGSSKDRAPPPERGPDARRDLRYRVPGRSEDSEWRRIEKEWERILPAPGIAARIAALAGALNSPERHVQRLARRLAGEPNLAALLRGAPPPLLHKPKHDHFSPQVDEDLPMLAHAEMRPPDTS